MAEKSWPHSGGHHKLAGLYDLKKTLGRGHFAVVRLAQHVFTGENVAIKVIDKTKLDQTSMDHLHHEVTCMKLVQHPNVVRLYEVIETSTKLYLILELGDGGDMYDYIMKHDQGLDEEQAKEYFAQILCAISYCHKMHVVHRDLKPENIVFFESQGLVKLTDFGFSNRYDPGKKLSTSCGSLAYSAPEILLGEEYDAQAVDVWSLGVILYMLVCGEAPFNEANDSETLTNIMDCKYTVLEHVNRDCSDLIRHMIIREPGERMKLEDIRNHPWLTNCATLRDDVYNSTPVLTRDLISEKLHLDIVRRMERGDLAQSEEIEEAINENKYNHITSTYYLLAHRGLEAQRKLSDVGPADTEMITSPAEARLTTIPISVPSGATAILPQTVCENLLPPSKTSIAYSSSPPIQASIIPVSQTGLHTPTLSSHLEDMNEDSSPASSNSSLYFSGHMSHAKGDKKMSPPFPREHLTITPRHGFSVAKGGIDTLIEEEERSRSQTTTDDEDDSMITNDAEEDITCAKIINPAQLASQLQRASLQQMKRLKKRKSAPVLNEICEENESEMNDFFQRPAILLHNQESRQAYRRKHTTSLCSTDGPDLLMSMEKGDTDMVDAEVFDVAKPGLINDTLQELRMEPGSAFILRKGHGLPKASHKSSGSETSDEDSESRRASRSSLHAAVISGFNRPRRDSSGDRDPSNGNSGRGNRTERRNSGPAVYSPSGYNDSDMTVADDASNQNSSETQDSVKEADTDIDNNNFNNSVQSEVLSERGRFRSITPNILLPVSSSENNPCNVLNNARGRHLQRTKQYPAPCNHICNIPEKRSKSAESNQSLRSACNSSQTSSARSSSSSLGYRRGRILTGQRVRKNSRSTMSDTGLVLRWNNVRKNGVPNSSSSSSVTSLTITIPSNNGSYFQNPNALPRPHSEGSVMDGPTRVGSFRVKSHKRQCRSTSLPRPNYVRNKLKNRRAASCGPHLCQSTGRKRPCTSGSTPIVSIQPSIPESGASTMEVAAAHLSDIKDSNIKRSNISLASSTCSNSKYAVDPVNELVLTPMEEEEMSSGTVAKHGSNVKFFKRIKKSTSSCSTDSLHYNKGVEGSDPPTPTKVSRIKMTFFPHIPTDGIFRRKSSSKMSPAGGNKKWFENGNRKMKPIPDSSMYGMMHREPLLVESPLLVRKTNNCCVIM